MRISDWSSDVCSSDLRAPDCARHRCGSERSRPNWSKASDVRNITGEGIVANVGGEDIRIVSPGHLARTSEEISDPRLKKLESQGKTVRSEEHTSELQSLMRISYAVFCLKKKKTIKRYN